MSNRDTIVILSLFLFTLYLVIGNVSDPSFPQKKMTPQAIALLNLSEINKYRGGKRRKIIKGNFIFNLPR